MCTVMSSLKRYACETFPHFSVCHPLSSTPRFVTLPTPAWSRAATGLSLRRVMMMSRGFCREPMPSTPPCIPPQLSAGICGSTRRSATVAMKFDIWICRVIRSASPAAGVSVSSVLAPLRLSTRSCDNGCAITRRSVE